MTNLTIKQGEDWGHSWPIIDPDTKQPVNISTWEVRAYIRRWDGGPVIATWSHNPAAGELLALRNNNRVTLLVKASESMAWGTSWQLGDFLVELDNPATLPNIDGVTRVDHGGIYLDWR